jgi:hypothetical protein
MEREAALRLDARLNPKKLGDLSQAIKMTDGARKALLAEDFFDHSPLPTDGDLVAALTRDTVAWDAAAQQLIATESSLDVDRTVKPLDKSPLFGDTSVEQCMEFAERYFRTQMKKAGRASGSFGEDFPVQHNIAPEVKALASGKVRMAGYSAYLNGGSVPPRAGDIVSMAAPDGEFHVAIISKVFRKDGNWFARVFEANVPFNTNDPNLDHHFEDLPMKVDNGRFTIAPAETSAKGYGMDMDVVGWIHPRGDKALPGADEATVPAGSKPAGQALGRVGRLLGVA